LHTARTFAFEIIRDYVTIFPGTGRDHHLLANLPLATLTHGLDFPSAVSARR
jgi:hypothetical protein